MLGQVTFIDHLTGVEYRIQLNGGSIKVGLASGKPYEDSPIPEESRVATFKAIYTLQDAVLGRTR